MSTILSPPLKWHGGKHYLAQRIVDMMPRHLHYVEPYAGGIAVLLKKDPSDPRHQWGEKSHEKGVSEVVNDLNGPLTNFWQVLQSDKAFAAFHRIAEATPFSEAGWQESEARQTPTHKLDIEAAAAFFVLCRQSLAGRMKDFATLSRNRTRRGMNEQASAWLTTIDGLSAVHKRLQRVVILCQDAINVIKSQDGDKTLFYLDPPYLPATRTSTDVYRHEMSKAEHRRLLDLLTGIQGRFLLSGYPNSLYDGFASKYGWNRVDFDLANNAAGGKEKRRMTECVWMN